MKIAKSTNVRSSKKREPTSRAEFWTPPNLLDVGGGPDANSVASVSATPMRNLSGPGEAGARPSSLSL